METSKPRVHGIGGVFFKARDPAALSALYRRHLGFPVTEWGGATFDWLAALRAEGCQVLDRREDGDFGRFGYVVDPEGLLLELWQPAEPPTPVP